MAFVPACQQGGCQSAAHLTFRGVRRVAQAEPPPTHRCPWASCPLPTPAQPWGPSRPILCGATRWGGDSHALPGEERGPGQVSREGWMGFGEGSLQVGRSEQTPAGQLDVNIKGEGRGSV